MVDGEAPGVGPFEGVVDGFAAEVAGWFVGCDAGPVAVALGSVAVCHAGAAVLSYSAGVCCLALGGSMSVVTDKKRRPLSAIISWVVTVLTLGYMLPWAIAATRGKRNAWAIFWLTVLLGWTLVGWLVAVVMSLNSHNLVAVNRPQPRGV